MKRSGKIIISITVREILDEEIVKEASMNNKTPTTEYANLALDELFQLVFVCRQISGDIKYAESVLQNRNNKWPDLPPVTNQPFNSAALRFIGILLLCQAVDIYDWYCRRVSKVSSIKQS